jgi:ABC-type multidrug transport system ATPase subunit
VLLDAALTLAPGELVGVTGENGSGKTTLLTILAGLQRPDRGHATHRGRIGYCPQEPLVYDRLRLAENVAYFSAAYGLDDWQPRMHRWAAQLRFSDHLGRVTSELSGGVRQKLNLVLALLHEPDVLLLDEPYAAFDWDTYLRFWEIAEGLKSAGRGVLIVSHLVYERSKFDRIYTLADGVLRCI